MKADIVCHLTGLPTLAVPGVNTLTELKSVLSEMINNGLKHVMTGFDMDLLKNPHVQTSYISLLWMIESLNLEYGTYLWEPNYNGLDDYCWTKHGNSKAE